MRILTHLPQILRLISQIEDAHISAGILYVLFNEGSGAYSYIFFMDYDRLMGAVISGVTVWKQPTAGHVEQSQCNAFSESCHMKVYSSTDMSLAYREITLKLHFGFSSACEREWTERGRESACEREYGYG